MKRSNEIVGENKDVDSTVAHIEDSQQNDDTNDIQYTASLLKQLKEIADHSGHRMLYHLINMAEMEANSIAQDKA